MNYRDIDRRIAEYVLGYKIAIERRPDGLMYVENTEGDIRHQVSHYSTDIGDAWLLADYLGRKYSSINIHVEDGMYKVVVDDHSDDETVTYHYEGHKETLPLAVCEAALRIVGQKLKGR